MPSAGSFRGPLTSSYQGQVGGDYKRGAGRVKREVTGSVRREIAALMWTDGANLLYFNSDARESAIQLGGGAPPGAHINDDSFGGLGSTASADEAGTAAQQMIQLRLNFIWC